MSLRARRGRLRLAAVGATLVVVLIACAALGAFAGAARGPGVAIKLPDKPQAFVSAQQIHDEGDVEAKVWVLRTEKGGEDEQVKLPKGLSVRKLITLAGGDPNTVPYVQILRPDGSAVYLSKADYADPSPFPEGPPFVYVTGTIANFFRPVADDEDPNALDRVHSSPGEALAVTGRTGNLLSVRVKASDTKVEASEPVSFSATATGGLPGEKLTYTWSFGDGKSDTGEKLEHIYAKAGSYQVTVAVAGDQDSGGVSASLTMTVGKATTGSGGGSGSGSGTGGGGSGGGDGSGTGGGGGSSGGGSSGGGADLGGFGGDLGGGSSGGDFGDGGSSGGGDFGGGPGADLGGGSTTPGGAGTDNLPGAPPENPNLVPVNGQLLGTTVVQLPNTAVGGKTLGSRNGRATPPKSAESSDPTVPIAGGLALLLLLFGGWREWRSDRGSTSTRAKIPLLR